MCFCQAEAPFYDRPHVFLEAFWHRKKNSIGEKRLRPKQNYKKVLFCIMQIFKIILNQPQLHCPTDISETCHLNPVLLMMSYCNGKLTFHGCNYFFFNRFKRKCFLQKYQFLSIPSKIQGFDLSEFSFQNLFWST